VQGLGKWAQDITRLKGYWQAKWNQTAAELCDKLAQKAPAVGAVIF
jgi:hypothetical protein